MHHLCGHNAPLLRNPCTILRGHAALKRRNMQYEEVNDYLINTFPDFTIDEVDEGLPYCVAGSFAFYLLEAYKNNDADTLVLAGKFIEELHSYKDEEIDNLATIGYLEGIQNVWGNNSINPEEMVKYLGSISQKWWIKLNRYWDGDVNALRESGSFLFSDSEKMPRE